MAQGSAAAGSAGGATSNWAAPEGERGRVLELKLAALAQKLQEDPLLKEVASLQSNVQKLQEE